MFLQGISLIFALVFRDAGLRFARRFVRTSAVDSLATPRFLPTDARIDPDTALKQAEKELTRLPLHLLAMLDTVRPEAEDETPHSARVLREANLALAARIEAFVHEVLDRSHSRTLLARGTSLNHRAHLLRDLTDSVAEFLDAVASAGAHPQLGPSVTNMIESLHLILTSVTEALATAENADLETARLLTGDRSQVMQRLRDRLSGETAGLSQDGHRVLFDLTSLFDRTLWLLHRLLPQPVGQVA